MVGVFLLGVHNAAIDTLLEGGTWIGGKGGGPYGGEGCRLAVQEIECALWDVMTPHHRDLQFCEMGEEEEGGRNRVICL